MFWFRHAHSQLRHAFQVKIEGLACMSEGFGQRFAACDDVREIREVNSVQRRLRLVGYRKNLPAVLMVAPHSSMRLTLVSAWPWAPLLRGLVRTALRSQRPGNAGHS